jgi:large subunit ribosomal protein L25
MSNVVSLKCRKRVNLGKGGSRWLRRGGEVPGVIYGGEGAVEAVTLPVKELSTCYNEHPFMYQLVKLDVEGDICLVVPYAVQKHPVSGAIMHVDFLRVSSDRKLSLRSRLLVVNQDKSIGVKRGGVVNMVCRSIDIVCLAKDIPPYIAIDIGERNIGDGIHVRDVVLPEGVELSKKYVRNVTLLTIVGRKTKDEQAEVVANKETKEAPTAAA